MTDLETMVAAYLEAIDFTETGDNDQPPSGTPLCAYDNAKTYIDCRNFHRAVTEELIPNGLVDVPLDWKQVGHDLWLTRNGHGVGFWDREEIYGDGLCRILTAMAKAMGGHDVTFEGQT